MRYLAVLAIAGLVASTTSAAAPKAAPSAKKPCDAKALRSYQRTLRLFDRGGEVLLDAACHPRRDNLVIVLVGGEWLTAPKAARLEIATALWREWADANPTLDPDHCRLLLVSSAGREVGGSRVWAGSLIWVED